MGGAADEFPLLGAHGLYAADIRGDGNCLFNALSDQLYGNQNEHQVIRARVIDYMREHASYYKQFLDVSPSNGVRRNPKRKNAGGYATPTLSTLPPSAEEVDRNFEAHLQQMARGGTYGDNMEITAFSAAYAVNVKIYQRDFAYVISGGGHDGGESEGERDTAHIAYHVWEHYSSIRNVTGPHTGLPDVHSLDVSSEDERKEKEKLAKTPYVAPWMIEVVVKSLPFLADRLTIKRTLEETRGNVDDAVSKLLDADDAGTNSGSVSSAPSSVERDQDSEDEDVVTGPNKKRDRRLSRATRAKQMATADYRARHSPLTNGMGRTSEADDDDEEDEDLQYRPYNPELSNANNNDLPTTILTPPSTINDIDHSIPRYPASAKDSDSASSYSTTSFSSVSQSRSSPPAAAHTPPSSSSQGNLPHPPRRKPGRPPKNSDTPLSPTSITHSKKGIVSAHRRVTARERRELKKSAQKAAAKQRKQQAQQGNHSRSAQQTSSAGPGGMKMSFRTGKENTPVLEAGIKVLYI